MNPIIRKMLPGLLPLLVFVLADELLGTQIGLIVAVVFGIGQLIFLRITQKLWDRFVIFDTLLLTALGGISMLLDNDTLFLWKPVLTESILVGFIALSLFSKHNLVLLMSKRYMGDMQINESQQKLFNRNLLVLFFITILHMAISVYSIYYMSKEGWVFVSGFLFYIMLGVYFAIMFISNYFKRKKINDEYVAVIDEDGKILQKASRSEVHRGTHLMHPVVHLHVIKRDGSVLLQKRPENKEIQPGKWDTAVGGHVSFGESIEKALQRETDEEIGLKDFKVIPIQQYTWKTEIETERVFMFACFVEENQRFKTTDEVSDLRWWTRKEIQRNLGKGIFTPNFEHEFSMLK